MMEKIDISDVSRLQLRDGSKVLYVFNDGNNGPEFPILVVYQCTDNVIGHRWVTDSGRVYYDRYEHSQDLIYKPGYEPRIKPVAVRIPYSAVKEEMATAMEKKTYKLHSQELDPCANLVRYAVNGGWIYKFSSSSAMAFVPDASVEIEDE